MVKEYREKYGEPDVVEVRQTFPTDTLAREWEEKILVKMNAAKSSKWLNKKNGDRKWCCSSHSEETKLKISKQVKKNRWSEEHRESHPSPLKGRSQKKEDVEKRIAPQRGRKHSEERIQKNRESHIGIKYPPRTEEYREKLRNLMIGRVFSPSHLENVSIANRERSKIRCSCVYCQKEIDINNFLRWHGEKCRTKMNIV